MEILQLKYFLESAKNQSFAKTAEKYMVPTSSVSASVKRLETELGCPLFDRYSNKIKINSKGERFLKSINLAFDEIDRAVVDVSGENADTREIKMLVRAMRDDITDYIIEFEKTYPHIAFKIALDFKETDYEKYDIIIDEKSDRHPGYEGFELSSMILKLMTNTDNPLAGKRLTMKDLKKESFVSWGEGSNMHAILERCCQRSGFNPNIAVMSSDMKCHEKLIESGLGIGLAREGAQNKGKMMALDIADFDETYTVYAYYKEKAAYGNVERFLNFLKEKQKGQ
ncbi:MAG: LysR family transcriptional regulator [Clostridia bacterium]|nr:LysR family transcriptional regulator [Clostridia bacterium]